MSYLVDTNILLRLVCKSDPQYPIARSAFVTLRKQNQEMHIIPQNLIEFWAVATRPINVNGLGLSINEASKETSLLKRLFIFKEGIPAIFREWESLVAKYQVMGRQVHDTRLVAAMIAHKMTNLLTFNTNDFKRFSEIDVIEPASI